MTLTAIMSKTLLATLLIAFFCQLVLSQDGISLVKLPENEGPLVPAREVEPAPRPEQVTVIAPRMLRPNSSYHILISLANSSVPATFELQLTGGRDSNREQTEAKSVLVSSDETQVVKFEVGNWAPAEYTLSANVLAVDRSWNFTTEESLYFSSKTFSILVQTDKPIYKPGQVVQFRALFVSPEMRPLLLKQQIYARIYDASRNLIKQWTEQTSTRGLLSLELPLSEDPVLGDWLIKIGARDQEVVKEFTVAEYVLPLFDVQVNLPSYATNNDSKVLATVRSTYTYGKPVRGQVLLTVQPLIRFNYLEALPMRETQLKAPLVNGVAEFTVDLLKDLGRQPEYHGREYEFHALVEEDLTGRKYNRSSTISLYETDVKIEMLQAHLPYKPGLDYTTTLKVAYRDGTPVEDNGPELELDYLLDNKKVRSVRLRPQGGLVQDTWQIPRPELDTSSANPSPYRINSLNIETTYRGYNFVEYLRQFVSSSNEYLKITLLGPEERKARGPRSLHFRGGIGGRRRHRHSNVDDDHSPSFAVNDKVTIRLNSTEPMQKATCYGMAGRDIIWAFNQNSPLNKTSVEFDIQISNKMAPRSSLTCYYIRKQDKEMIADSVHFQVSGALKNPVKVLVSEPEVKPGQSVDVEVLTKPYSTVGLLAVDQSVLLLKSGNDITEETVESELKSYSSTDESYHFRSSIDSLFDNQEVVVMTNNYLFYDMISRIANMSPGVTANKFRSNLMIPYQDSPMTLDSMALPAATIAGQPPKPVIRSFFPETWIWTNGISGADGRFTHSAKVPDTITSWVLSAFSLSNADGLGVSSQETRLKVFRPFFIKLNLPYSIVRGETVSIQATLFNYSKRPLNATVTLENKHGEFQFVEAANSVDDEKYSGVDEESHQVQVGAQDGASVNFLITPTKLGQLDLRVRALSQFAADAVSRKLLVKAEGQTQYLNQAVLINLGGAGVDSSRRMARNLSLEFPVNYVNGSEKVFVSAIGDVLGAGLSNADDLLRMPYGCGEQNMVNLVPNIVMLNYLEQSGRAKPALRKKALANIEKGYQRQLTYKRSDGSFSAFGESDATGSVWLTAYVLKSFQQARNLTQVDERVLRGAARYIARHSQSDGSIRETGMLHNKALSSKAADGSPVYLTAYCMIALLQRGAKLEEDSSSGDQENSFSPAGSSSSKPLSEVISGGLRYLEERLRPGASTYEIAIIAYALHLADRKEALSRAQDELWRASSGSGDQVWWEMARELQSAALLQEAPSSSSSTIPPLQPLARNQKQSAHLFAPDSLSVEMTALALLTVVHRGELEQATPIVKWLVSQQNSNGGFSSTQDTVLAIEALASFAGASSAASSAHPEMELKLSTPVLNDPLRSSSLKDTFHISTSNQLVLQQTRLPDDTRTVQLEATGTGMCVLQVSWQYNLLVSAERPAFYLNPIVDRKSTVNYLQLNICTYYRASDSTNMALMEVELPSGYTADVEALPSLKRLHQVRRIESVERDSRVIIYFDRLTRDELCLTLTAHRTSKVSNIKPAPVSIYDYYDRNKAARIFYMPKSASSCDICDSDDCKKRCNK